MKQTNVDNVSVVFIEMLILSCFILFSRFCCSVERIGRCRMLGSFCFHNCVLSTQTFMGREKKIFGRLGCVCFLALRTVERVKHFDL